MPQTKKVEFCFEKEPVDSSSKKDLKYVNAVTFNDSDNKTRESLKSISRVCILIRADQITERHASHA